MCWYEVRPQKATASMPPQEISEEFPEHLKEFKIRMNRKLTTLLATALIALPLSLTAQAAPAAATAPATTPGGAKVGIIDVQQVIVATNEGQRDFEQLQKKFDPKIQL